MVPVLFVPSGQLRFVVMSVRVPRLPREVLDAMRAGLPALADRMVEAVVAEVPELAAAAQESWRPVVYASADTLLSALVEQLRGAADPGASVLTTEILDAAYGFGQREARQGRPTEVQLAAYRLGAREIWREWSALAVKHGMPSEEVSVFAELSFAYLDRISAAAVAGHADEQARSGLARQRRRERLVRTLLEDGDDDVAREAAESAGWTPPRTLTALALPAPRHRSTAPILSDPRTLEVPDDAVDMPQGLRVFLACDVGGRARRPFLDAITAAGAVVGPARPWLQAATSVRRVERAARLAPDSAGVLDTELLLPELVVSADPDALADLRARALAPLADLSPVTAQRLAATLRSWLLHHGRRDAIAADLFVSPSTIRYRLRQLRERYGSQLENPRAIAELTIALATFDSEAAG